MARPQLGAQAGCAAAWPVAGGPTPHSTVILFDAPPHKHTLPKHCKMLMFKAVSIKMCMKRASDHVNDKPGHTGASWWNPSLYISHTVYRYIYIYIYDVGICFPTPGRGLPYGSGLGLSRCLGPGECLHSFIHSFIHSIL